MEQYYLDLINENKTPAAVLSLRDLAVNSILASRNYHRIIQMYEFCINSGQFHAADTAKKFISDKFAFFLERYE